MSISYLFCHPFFNCQLKILHSNIKPHKMVLLVCSRMPNCSWGCQNYDLFILFIIGVFGFPICLWCVSTCSLLNLLPNFQLIRQENNSCHHVQFFLPESSRFGSHSFFNNSIGNLFKYWSRQLETSLKLICQVV